MGNNIGLDDIVLANIAQDPQPTNTIIAGMIRESDPLNAGVSSLVFRPLVAGQTASISTSGASWPITGAAELILLIRVDNPTPAVITATIIYNGASTSTGVDIPALTQSYQTIRLPLSDFGLGSDFGFNELVFEASGPSPDIRIWGAWITETGP